MWHLIDLRQITRIIHGRLAVIAVGLFCLISFPRFVSYLETTCYGPGAKPGAYFRIAVASGDASRPFKLVRLDEAEQSGATLYMQSARQNNPSEFSFETVRILSSDTRYTRIETQNGDDDYTFVSRYRVEASRIEPESLRIFGLPQGLQGALAALIFTGLLFWILRKRFPKH